MGHFTASCAVSGLPIRSQQRCVAVVMTPEIGDYINSGVYNLMQRIEWRRQGIKYNGELRKLIVKHLGEKGQEILPEAYEDPKQPPLFLYHEGKYNEYGSLEHLDRDDFGGQHLFVHGDIWDFIQTTYPEWTKKQWWYKFARERGDEIVPICPVETLFGFCMAQRIELTFGPPILGAQDWEPLEYEYKAQFLETVTAVNGLMKDYMVEEYGWYSNEEEE